MTREENVFWTKRNLVDYIWKSDNLEGIAVTFPETQTTYEGISVQVKSIGVINSIVQMKRGWQLLLDTLDEDLTLAYVKRLHLKLEKMTVINAGSPRMDEVRIPGSSYITPLPNKNDVKSALSCIRNADVGWTEKALDYMLYLVKNQLFYDGNMRIAMMIANKVLINHGCGILSVAQEHLEQFFILLVNYYEDESQKENLKLFLYDECLDGYKKSIE